MNNQEIMERVKEHRDFALETYKDYDWFVICLQGSQNYGIADETSDIDTKMLILPTLSDLILNKKPISNTLVLPNNEHCDVKDIRDYFKIFRKSNINFVEILFTDYWIVNYKYRDLWLTLLQFREELARINPYAAVSCMSGMAKEKRHALTHEYPSRMEYIEKYGYDGKQLSHLARIYYFIRKYVEQKDYIDCIIPDDDYKKYLLDLKRHQILDIDKEEAEKVADEFVEEIQKIANYFRKNVENKNDPDMDALLNEVLEEVMVRSIKENL